MAEKSSIEWTDASWSPLRAQVKENAAAIAKSRGYESLIKIGEKMAGRVGHHCEHVSPECEHCYSESFQSRCLTVNGTGLPFDRRSRDLIDGIVDENILTQPLRWKSPRRIFVESQSDLFGEWFSFEQIDEVFTAMVAADHHTYQILTKRPQRALEYFRSGRHNCGNGPDRADYHLDGKVWVGVTAGTKTGWNERIPLLRHIPAAVRFVSAEPLLEDIGHVDLTGVDWVIVGGESGHGARPMHPDWARSLRDQCQADGVAFHFKQHGEWVQTDRAFEYYAYGRPVRDNRTFNIQLRKYIKECGATEARDPGLLLEGISELCINYEDKAIVKVGKKAAGRLLDGREWNEFPEVQR